MYSIKMLKKHLLKLNYDDLFNNCIFDSQSNLLVSL